MKCGDKSFVQVGNFWDFDQISSHWKHVLCEEEQQASTYGIP